MSISIRLWISIAIIAISYFISVNCSASADILAEYETSNQEGVVVSNITGNELGNSTVEPNKGKDRGIFARCFGTIWDWMSEKAVGVMEDKIISGNPDNVRFYLYPNPNNKDDVQEIVYGDTTSLSRAHISYDQPWKIIIHGFTNHHISEPVQQIKNAYLTRMEQLRFATRGSRNAPGYNVIVVDWGMLADPKFSGDAGNLFYGFAVKNVPLVGKRVGEFVYFLLQNRVVKSLDQIHLLGFSLGSHVSGNAGNTLRELMGEVPARITGLDPAGPSFYQGLSLHSRQLSTEDARFVDIIHTNQGALGILKNIGHVDFYPNGGGPIQKPCLVQYGQSQNENALVMLNTCSHSKAPYFFSLSVNRQITSCKCESLLQWKTTCPCTEKALFGEYCDSRTRGTYYLDLSE